MQHKNNLIYDATLFNELSKYAMFYLYSLFSFILSGVAAFSPSSNARLPMSIAAKSKSVPFLEQPKALDGTLAGDRGFDPVGFTNAKRFKYTPGKVL